MGEVTNRCDPVDELLGVLQSRRRRLAIYYLCNHREGEPVGVDALAAAIAAMEIAGTQPWADVGTAGMPLLSVGGETDGNRTEHLRISLVHTHLPKLEETGIVEYDHASGTVRATRPPKEFWERLRRHQQFSAGLSATEVE